MNWELESILYVFVAYCNETLRRIDRMIMNMCHISAAPQGEVIFPSQGL